MTKEPLDEQGRNLAVREGAWYEKARKEQIKGIPRICETDPLQMEYIEGKAHLRKWAGLQEYLFLQK